MAITILARSPGLTWSVPNILTYGRVAAVPVVAACLFWPEIAWLRWVALGIFIAAGITDFLDGYLARALVAAIARSAKCSIRSPTSCSSPPS